MSGKKTNRLVAEACHAHSHAGETSLKSLRPHLIDEIIAFFTRYNRQHGKEFRRTGCADRGTPAGSSMRARFRRKVS